jgi:hypothetical protein
MTRETDKRTNRDRRSNSDHRAQLPPSVSDNIETIADFYARNEQHLTLSQASSKSAAPSSAALATWPAASCS